MFYVVVLIGVCDLGIGQERKGHVLTVVFLCVKLTRVCGAG